MLYFKVFHWSPTFLYWWIHINSIGLLVHPFICTVPKRRRLESLSILSLRVSFHHYLRRNESRRPRRYGREPCSRRVGEVHKWLVLRGHHWTKCKQKSIDIDKWSRGTGVVSQTVCSLLVIDKRLNFTQRTDPTRRIKYTYSLVYGLQQGVHNPLVGTCFVRLRDDSSQKTRLPSSV